MVVFRSFFEEYSLIWPKLNIEKKSDVGMKCFIYFVYSVSFWNDMQIFIYFIWLVSETLSVKELYFELLRKKYDMVLNSLTPGKIDIYLFSF